ncbi:MAG: hypothetical protein GXO62_02370 [Epsilonproteobacteria bacterium]|nr:hypothetical protein [Campylobacterota bacterium]
MTEIKQYRNNPTKTKKPKRKSNPTQIDVDELLDIAKKCVEAFELNEIETKKSAMTYIVR